MSKQGRFERMQLKQQEAQRKRIEEVRLAFPLKQACGNITHVRGVSIQDLAMAVLDQFKDSGISRETLAMNFATVVKQESGPQPR
jgi:hypothetical protein